MRACRAHRFGGPDVITIDDVEAPEPAAGQVRIAVTAGAVNPVDVAMRLGVFGGPTPLGLGWDVAGVIESVGPGSAWSVGQRVMGLATNHVKPFGTHSDLAVLDDDAIAASPTTVDDIAAASLPLNTLSAFQALAILDVKDGQSLLVTGAAGGVGCHAVEIASERGVVVTAMGRPADEEMLMRRGAAAFIARGTRIPDRVFDAVLDAAGLNEVALASARDGGTHIGLWPGQQPSGVRGVRVAALDVRADSHQLRHIADLVDRGVVAARISEVLPLEAAAQAHTMMGEGGRRGRILLAT